MPLRFLLDEDLRGPLWNALVRHNATSPYPIDVIRVGDANAPPTGTLDPQLLRWAQQQGRILVTFD